MAQKNFNFITTSSERARKAIAVIALGMAGIMLFFAWTAGVSARLPLLASEFDFSLPSPGQQSQDMEPIASPATTTEGGQAAVSPMKGLIDSFQDMVHLFQGGYPGLSDSSAAWPSANGSPARPIDGLFDKLADEAPATESTTTPQEDLTPAEELPGL